MLDLTLTRILTDSQAIEDPRRHRDRVLALAARGPRVVRALATVALLAVVAAAYMGWKWHADGGGFVTFAMGILLAVFGLYLFASVTFSPERPRELEVHRAQAPGLFSMVDKAIEIVGAPAIHHVMITDGFDLNVIHVPRFGVWDLPRVGRIGGTRNYLLIGLPLLQTLSTNQFAALLVHHMMRNRLMSTTPLGRAVHERAVWWRAYQTLRRRRSPTVWPLRLFAASHATKLYALGIPLVMDLAIEADSKTAALIGKPLLGEAFAGHAVGAKFYEEEYLPRVNAQAAESPQPTASLYGQIADAALSMWQGRDAQRLLSASLTHRTDLTDTSPCLADRLAALGVAAKAPTPPSKPAAMAAFGERQASLIAHLDAAWWRQHSSQWQLRFKDAQAARDELLQLKLAEAGGRLSADEWVRLAELMERFEPTGNIEGALAAALAADGTHPVAAFKLGMRRLAVGDQAGVEMLRTAMDAGYKIAESAALAASYLRAHGQGQDARRFEEGAKAHRTAELKALEQLSNVRANDAFVAHGLKPHELRTLVSLINAHDGIAAAFLARKNHATVQHASLLILAIKFEKNPTTPPYRILRMIEAELQLPTRYQVILLDHTQAQLHKTLQALAHASLPRVADSVL